MSNESVDAKDAKKDVTVIFNGRERQVPKDFLTFDEVIAYAFDNPPKGDAVQFTVQYTKGPKDNPKGTLLEGGSVKVKKGMIFDVTPTNRS
jgi:hypothetical protein